MSATDVDTIVGLLAVVAVLAQMARRWRIPYPIVLVLAGLALGLLPGIPSPTLDPQLFFLVFLPPLLYSEAFLYSTDALRAAAVEITLLAVGLVLATAVAVAVVAHAAAGLPWPAAFVLGGVVGSTDPVSATTLLRRAGVSERVVTILEGESLVNDGTALVIFRLAIAAVGAAALSPSFALAEFVRVSLGGIATGLLAAALGAWARRRLTVMEANVTFSLLMPFVAYLPAERLGVSGVLAAVTAGLVLGSRPDEMAPSARLHLHVFWEVLAFLLNSSIFLLIGLATRGVLGRISDAVLGTLAERALLLAATVIGIRLAWMLLLAPLIAPRPRSELLVLGWSGMRGGVSLAAALSVPVVAAGHPFPGRDEIVFYAYAIVLATLVVPGLTLPSLIERLGVVTPEQRERNRARARDHIVRAALEHIAELVQSGEVPEEVTTHLRQLYEERLKSREPDGDGAAPAEVVLARRGVVAAQRSALAELAEAGRISDDAAGELADELDAEELSCA